MDKTKIIIIFVALACAYIPLHWLIAKFIMKPFMKALLNKQKIPLTQIAAMHLRGNPAELIIDAYIILHHSNIQISLDRLESIYVTNKKLICDCESLVELVKSNYITEN